MDTTAPPRPQIGRLAKAVIALALALAAFAYSVYVSAPLGPLPGRCAVGITGGRSLIEVEGVGAGTVCLATLLRRPDAFYPNPRREGDVDCRLDTGGVRLTKRAPDASKREFSDDCHMWNITLFTR